jgi:hypothetical protein
MKKLVLLLTIITLSYSCSSDSNSNSNNPSNGNVDYYFKIKINGVEHKVQGNTSGFAVGNDNTSDLNPNACQAQIGTTTYLSFEIADITRPNYISGQNLNIFISIPNCQVGLNQAGLAIFTSPVWHDFVQGNNLGPDGAFVENSGLYCSSNAGMDCQYPNWQSNLSKITINITDMGTPSESSPPGSTSNYDYSYGNTVKGFFNGPLYFRTSSSYTPNGNQVFNMNTPIQFSMEFEAYRTN